MSWIIVSGVGLVSVLDSVEDFSLPFSTVIVGCTVHFLIGAQLLKITSIKSTDSSLIVD